MLTEFAALKEFAITVLRKCFFEIEGGNNCAAGKRKLS